jgi:hypothetical protein
MFFRIYTQHNNEYIKNPNTFICISINDILYFQKIKFTSLKKKFINILKNDEVYNILNISKKYEINDNKLLQLLQYNNNQCFEAKLFYNHITNYVIFIDNNYFNDIILERINLKIIEQFSF